MQLLSGLAIMLGGFTATIVGVFWLHHLFGTAEQKEDAKQAYQISRRLGVLGTLAAIVALIVAVIAVKGLMVFLALAIIGS